MAYLCLHLHESIILRNQTLQSGDCQRVSGVFGRNHAGCPPLPPTTLSEMLIHPSGDNCVFVNSAQMCGIALLTGVPLLFLRVKREDLKYSVKKHEIRLLAATDAACEGLNLQTLGTLINVSLPWSPARLEQRPGRIERFGRRTKKFTVSYSGGCTTDMTSSVACAARPAIYSPCAMSKPSILT